LLRLRRSPVYRESSAHSTPGASASSAASARENVGQNPAFGLRFGDVSEGFVVVRDGAGAVAGAAVGAGAVVGAPADRVPVFVEVELVGAPPPFVADRGGAFGAVGAPVRRVSSGSDAADAGGAVAKGAAEAADGVPTEGSALAPPPADSPARSPSPGVASPRGVSISGGGFAAAAVAEVGLPSPSRAASALCASESAAGPLGTNAKTAAPARTNVASAAPAIARPARRFGEPAIDATAPERAPGSVPGFVVALGIGMVPFISLKLAATPRGGGGNGGGVKLAPGGGALHAGPTA
jgi:hypothetical protein